MNSHLTILALLLALSSSCWSQVHTSSSPCVITAASVICTGASITDASLLLLKDELHLRFSHMYFLSLHVSETEVTNIASGTFADVQFENIYIQDNLKLTTIAEDAFIKQTTTSLYIINNPKLKSNSVYKVTDTLHVSEAVDLDFNGLVEVPSHAFNEQITPAEFYANMKVVHTSGHTEQKVPELVKAMQAIAKAPAINEAKKINFRKLVISNNQIERINTNAFHLMQSCNQIFLNYNKLSHIQTKGFNLIDHLGSKATGSSTDLHLTIRLDSNRLTKDSFESEFISMNDHTNLYVNLTANQISEVKEDIFKPLLTNHQIMVDFTSNPIDCHSVAWLKADSKLMLKTKGIAC